MLSKWFWLCEKGGTLAILLDKDASDMKILIY